MMLKIRRKTNKIFATLWKHLAPKGNPWMFVINAANKKKQTYQNLVYTQRHTHTHTQTHINRDRINMKKYMLFLFNIEQKRRG